MTPEEKAKELYNKYLVLASDETIEKRERTAKQCALICIDEAMDVSAFVDHKIKNKFAESIGYSDKYFFTYWEDVKIELEKL